MTTSSQTHYVSCTPLLYKVHLFPTKNRESPGGYLHRILLKWMGPLGGFCHCLGWWHDSRETALSLFNYEQSHLCPSPRASFCHENMKSLMEYWMLYKSKIEILSKFCCLPSIPRNIYLQLVSLHKYLKTPADTASAHKQFLSIPHVGWVCLGVLGVWVNRRPDGVQEAKSWHARLSAEVPCAHAPAQRMGKNTPLSTGHPTGMGGQLPRGTF